MRFFPDDLEQPEPEEPAHEPRPWWEVPEHELPGIIPARGIVATSEHVAIALVGVHVYSTGVQLRLTRRLRRLDLPVGAWGRLTNRFMEHMGDDEPAERLRHGLVLPGGERVVEGGFGVPGFDPMARPEGFALMRHGGGGGGGDRSFESSDRLWLWPMPPAGTIELVVQWPSMGIAESRLAVDVSELDARADEVMPLWSEPGAR